MSGADDNALPAPHSHPETRPRKRRRRTVACTQCRSKKLKCDREYPSCGRCAKSRIPERCTYEDSIVWQYPSTVDGAAGTTAALPSTSSPAHITLPPPNRVAAASPGFSSVLVNPYPKLAPPGAVPPPQQLFPQSLPPSSSSSHHIHHISTPDFRQSGASRPRFLDTVLDGPNTPATSTWSRLPDGNAAQRDHASSYDNAPVSPSQRLDMHNKVLIRGKGTRTRFNGGGMMSNLMLQVCSPKEELIPCSTYLLTNCAQFPELKSFLHEVKANNPNFSRIRNAKDALKLGSVKAKMQEPIAIPNTATLLSLLPARATMDALLRLYMLYVESMHRVLHIPSFRQELSELYANYNNPDMISAAFVAQVLLMLASASGFHDAEPSLDYTESITTIKSEQVVEWIRYAERWFESTHIKRPDLTVLRIQCLLIISKNNQGLNRSHAWLATGNLVKLAMLAGYHRDPEEIPKISNFNKEMRRRIWATIVELDVQISFDRGMPPTLQATDYDTVPPLNINDDEIHENITEKPMSRPAEEVTDCSFQTILARSLALRLKICSLMNSPVISCTYEDILRLEWEIGRLQANIPSWPTTADKEISHKLTLWNAMLETKLGQALLAIHTPFAIEAPKDPLFAPSSRSRLEVATVILSRHLKLHETSARLSFGHSADSIVQAAFSVLQHLFARRPGCASNLVRHVIPAITDSLLDLVDRIILTLETRLVLVIKSAKQFFFLYMIFALVKSALYPEQADEIRSVILDRICMTTYRILRGVDGTSNVDGIDLVANPSLNVYRYTNEMNQASLTVPSLTSNHHENNTPLESVPGSFDSSNLSDLLLTVFLPLFFSFIKTKLISITATGRLQQSSPSARLGRLFRVSDIHVKLFPHYIIYIYIYIIHALLYYILLLSILFLATTHLLVLSVYNALFFIQVAPFQLLAACNNPYIPSPFLNKLKIHAVFHRRLGFGSWDAIESIHSLDNLEAERYTG
jgi:Fungal specific transcription factor domain/Fungal Zn(2)-Cys(6) binuclear cluster domain